MVSTAIWRFLHFTFLPASKPHCRPSPVVFTDCASIMAAVGRAFLLPAAFFEKISLNDNCGRNAICSALPQVMSDYWSPYEKFVPKDLHTQSKAETFTVEGYNSLFRHFLARLRRKSKCYSKEPRHAEIFRHAFDAEIKWRTGFYT